MTDWHDKYQQTTSSSSVCINKPFPVVSVNILVVKVTDFENGRSICVNTKTTQEI